MTPAPMSFRQLREDLPLTRRLAYFQTGSYGPTPDSVLKVVAETMAFQSRHGSASPEVTGILLDQEQRVRRQLADFLGVRPEHLAWTSNTSQAMQRVLRSVDWQAGDEILVSSAEHVSTQDACRALERHRGVVVRTFPAEAGDDALLSSLEAALSGRARMVCLSQISTLDGRKLPAREAAGLARTRGVRLMLDGAQAVGQFPVEIPALGCDYYIASGHKWLLGPLGVGFLWVSPDRLADFRPDYIPDASTWLKPGDPRPPVTAALRSELGTHNYALRIGLGRALEIMEALGPARIERYVQELVQLLFGELENRPGVRILTPTKPGRASGLVALEYGELRETGLRRLVEDLLERRIVVKFQPERPALRVSVAAFNTREEILRLVDALATLIG
ncbi:MAG: aminotransferase class V-fold PLP-dependent enzyme [Acidobacteriota bacterium]|nr:aminotransferase class V-fold PLP-dependent enzyme [Acidobacteriota bacterium]